MCQHLALTCYKACCAQCSAHHSHGAQCWVPALPLLGSSLWSLAHHLTLGAGHLTSDPLLALHHLNGSRIKSLNLNLDFSFSLLLWYFLKVVFPCSAFWGLGIWLVYFNFVLYCLFHYSTSLVFLFLFSFANSQNWLFSFSLFLYIFTSTFFSSLFITNTSYNTIAFALFISWNDKHFSILLPLILSS